MHGESRPEPCAFRDRKMKMHKLSFCLENLLMTFNCSTNLKCFRILTCGVTLTAPDRHDEDGRAARSRRSADADPTPRAQTVRPDTAQPQHLPAPQHRQKVCEPRASQEVLKLVRSFLCLENGSKNEILFHVCSSEDAEDAQRRKSQSEQEDPRSSAARRGNHPDGERARRKKGRLEIGDNDVYTAGVPKHKPPMSQVQ